MRNILDEIVARRRAEPVDEPVPAERSVPLLPFPGDGFALIAEVKKASPSRGRFHPERDPLELARAYREGGATAVSVLTEPHYFEGSLADLRSVREAVGLPVLRKDFLTEPEQIAQAYRAGADAVLLIAAVLRNRLRPMLEAAAELGIAALTEVHDERELDAALGAGANLLGINNRDLVTFEVDVETCHRLKPRVPDTVAVIAESGFGTGDELRRLRDAGFAGVLIGESLVVAADPRQRVRELASAVVATS